MLAALLLLHATSALTGSRPHIAIFGGTGGVGAEAAYQALERGAKVSVLCRSPGKLLTPPGSGGGAAGSKLVSDRLRVCTGDVTCLTDVQAVFQDEPITGCVVALGGRTTEVGPTMLRDGTANIIAAMSGAESPTKRISVVTSIGAGDSYDQAPFLFKVLMWTALKDAFVDKNAQEALFLNGPGKDLEFTIVRPGGLTLGPPTGTTQVISGQAGSISRADVAAFCLDAVIDDEFPYVRKTPCISAK